MHKHGTDFKGRRPRFSIWQFVLRNQEGEGGSVAGGGAGDAGASSADGSATADAGHVVEINPGAPTVTPAAPDFASRVPEAYREKPYLANILASANPEEELFKQFDGLQSKLGQRPGGLPDENASDEDWAKYKESIRAKSADDYTFPELDLGDEDKDIAEFMNTFRDDASEAELRNIMFETGIPKKLASELMGKLEKWQVGKFKDTFKQVAQTKADTDTRFDAGLQKYFGGDKDTALKQGSEYIARHVPAEFRADLQALPNEALMVLAFAGLNEKKAHGTEDTVGQRNIAGGTSVDELRAEMRQHLASEEFRNKMRPLHGKTQDRLKVLRESLAAAQTRK